MRAFGRLAIATLLLSGGALPATAAVPTLLLDIRDSGVADPDDSGIEGRFLSLGDRALVPVREPSSGRELWVTDGTDVGTRPLRDFCLGSCASDFDLLGTVGGVGVFLVYPNGISQEPSLWRSDGTRPGTFVLAGPGQAPGRCALSTVAESAVLGRSLLFSGRTDAGCALWKTDGTVAGTVPLKEITSADLGSHVLHEMAAVGGRVFFAVPDLDGWGLWASNGTAAGTVRLRSFSGEPSTLVAAGSRLFFAAPDEGMELWTSDGTVAGTRPVTRFSPVDPFVFHNELALDQRFVFQEIDGQLYFLANDGVTGREIWRSDGTAAGTRPVTSMVNASPFIGLPTWRIQKLDGRLLFKANDGLTGPRLWTTNGQPASTAPLAGCAGGCPVLDPETGLVRVGARLFFAASPDGTRSGLWVTDGTGTGTRKIRDFCAECGPERMVSLLGRLFFAAGSSFDWDLWVSDGTAAGTRLVRDLLVSRPEDVLPFPPVALETLGLLAVAHPVSGRVQLWRTDGTPEGTALVTSIGSNGLTSFPRSLVPAGNVVRFLAHEPVWTSSGTAATTQPLISRFFADELAPLGSWTLMIDRAGPLARTDGTTAGTIQLTPDDLIISEVVSLGSRAVFSANDFEEGRSLWATDGTIAGTQKIVSENAESLLRAGSEVFFLGPLGSVGRIWSTDGTAAGTRPAIPAGVQIATPLRVARLGPLVFFSAYASNLGPRLWRSDGTDSGTSLVLPDQVKEPGALTVHQGQLYFVAATGSESLVGLWRSDGTDAGTVLLRTFERANSLFDLTAAHLTPLGSLLYFVASGESGRELWRTDGTSAGTVLVRDIAPGEESSYPSDLETMNGHLYFTANDGEHGIELWESDGTTAGTHLLLDIAPGAFSSDPWELTAAGGRLYFTANDHVHGREPWVYAPEVAGCEPSEFVLCLGNGRFRVEADWRDFDGGNGRGRAVALTADTGTFWFFEPSNVEVILKVLDGQGLNGHHWVFYGALSSVEYTLTVTDTSTGAVRRYINPPGVLGSVADTQAFGPLGAHLPGVVTDGPAPAGSSVPRMAVLSAAAEGSCVPSATRLCLNDGRFAVEARWKDFAGNTGTGKAVPLAGADTGTFWFFDASNVEVVLKVLDGRPLNGKFWIFYGALSSVEYTLTVTDTVTGTVRTYTNPSGRLASVADTGAF